MSGKDKETAGVVHQALKTEQDTTSTLVSALKTTQKAKQVGVETLEELKAQDELLNYATTKAEKINEDLSYAKQLTRYLHRCFCCFICCDPPEKRIPRQPKNDQQRAGAQDAGVKNSDDPRQHLLPQGKAGRYQPEAASNYEGQLGKHGFEDEARQIDEERKKQQPILGQIYDGLDELHQIALAQGDMVAHQAPKIQMLHNTVQAAQATTLDVKENIRKKK